MQQPPEGNYQPPSQPPYSQQPTQQPYNPQQAPVPPPPYNYGAYPPQQPPIVPKKPRRWPWIVAIIVAFILGDMAGRGHTTTNTTAAAPVNQNTSISQTQPTQAPTQPTKPLTWTTTQTFTGNGSKKTGTFAVPDDWKIKWTCNPASFGGADYNMIIAVYNSDGSIADFGAVNATCKNGSVSGESEEHQAGTVYLDITSEGDWNITVQELK